MNKVLDVEQVVLTMEQYSKLSVKDPNTMYIVTNLSQDKKSNLIQIIN